MIDPAYCECGCGEVTNPVAVEMARLRAQGLTHKAIAERLGCTRQHVGGLLNRSTASRFIRGHDPRNLRSGARTEKYDLTTLQGRANKNTEGRKEFEREMKRKAVDREEAWFASKRRIYIDTTRSCDFLGERHTEPDPFEVITGATPHHLEELLGELAIEDVVRMDERELQVLRGKILAAGLAPSSVQRKERERLKVVTPHRGEAPAPKRTPKSSRHRGRKEASQLMSGRGKRFKRVNSQPRDGWGGVVLPEDVEDAA